MGPEVLTVDQHAEADRIAVHWGVTMAALMEAAGAGVADAIQRRWSARPTVVLCGPGNNGGDGRVAARRLREPGWPVTVLDMQSMSPAGLEGAALVVDAVFGAGLSRPVQGAVAATLAAVAERKLPTVAIDVPSGVDGDTGAIRGLAVPAALTVTFFRKKPAHVLVPAREICGEIDVVDIGTPTAALQQIEVAIWENGPALWELPKPEAQGHKYGRGHVLVLSGGPTSTGAARLAARAALRVGAGLVTLAGSAAALTVHAAHVSEILLEPCDGAADLRRLLAERRRNVAIVGPGNGAGEPTRACVLAALQSGARCVLDADALTSFADRRAELLQALRPGCVLTPHDGEFTRLFLNAATREGRLARARAAAAEAGVVVLLKGPDTVIAHPDGRAVVNTNAPPTLATAGSGDVLAGFVGGLLAQGSEAWVAASAAVWLHGEAALRHGPGLIASDLIEELPGLLRGKTAAPAATKVRRRPAIEVREAQAMPLAALHGESTIAAVPRTIRDLFAKVYDALGREPVTNLGVNVVLYDGHMPRLGIDAGVRLLAPLRRHGTLAPVSTPAGRTLTTTHWGVYELLPDVHVAVRAWAKAHGHELAGPNWEVYGHWSDDPGERRTDVYYLLR